jgi:hypothetical protein
MLIILEFQCLNSGSKLMIILMAQPLHLHMKECIIFPLQGRCPAVCGDKDMPQGWLHGSMRYASLNLKD